MGFGAAAAVAAIFGAIIGYSQTFVFAKIPEKWLQDYGVKETDPDFRLSKRMKLIPHGVLSALFCAAIYTLFVVFSYIRHKTDGWQSISAVKQKLDDGAEITRMSYNNGYGGGCCNNCGCNNNCGCSNNCCNDCGCSNGCC